jgi:hypothetical protein
MVVVRVPVVLATATAFLQAPASAACGEIAAAFSQRPRSPSGPRCSPSAVPTIPKMSRNSHVTNFQASASTAELLALISTCTGSRRKVKISLNYPGLTFFFQGLHADDAVPFFEFFSPFSGAKLLYARFCY